MKERPILFNTAMVQAIDAGSKTMTRRTKGLEIINQAPDDFVLDYISTYLNGDRVVRFGKTGDSIFKKLIKCPYGKIGDLLWIKETFYELGFEGNYQYKADGDTLLTDGDKWRPSIHMPKAAARTWLKITDIRVERLQDITAADAVAEGIGTLPPWPEAPDRPRYQLYGDMFSVEGQESAVFDPIMSFYSLWCSVIGDRAVKENLWVWVVVFEKVEAPVAAP